MAGERSDLGKIFITDGGIYDANTTYEKLTMVSYNNSTYITLRTVTGVTPSNDRINYGLMAQGFTATYLSSVTAEDVQGLVVEAGSETPAQSLINAIADRVANQLVSNSDLQDILSDYILKSAIANNLSITEEGKVLDARQGKALNDAYTTLNNTVYNHTEHPVSVNSNFENFSWEALVYYKIGKIVFVHGAGTWKGSANPVNVVFATGLPKPRQNTSIPCALNASSNSVNVVVSLNGELRLYASSMATNTSFYVCLSYVEG